MENLSLLPLISEIDCLRVELGYPRFSSLHPWCDQHPLTADEGALWRLLERLSVVWADGQ